MLKTKIIVFSLAAGTIASFLIQETAKEKFHQRQTLLRRTQDEVAQLIEQQRRISNALSRAAIPRAEDHASELAKLRAEVEALRWQSKAMAKKSKQPNASRTPKVNDQIEAHPQEYWDQLRAAAGSKSLDARNLAMAAWEYADQHKNQMPTNLDELAPYLNKTPDSKLSGTNQFDLVFQGSIDDLKGIPNSEIAVVRDRQTWTSPDGKTFRVYGMMGGSGQIVSSDDNFQSWEAEHIIGSLRK